MPGTLPNTTLEFMNWSWSQIEPYYAELADRPLTEETVETWLLDWTALVRLLSETGSRLQIATTVNTEDKDAVTRLQNFMVNIAEPAASQEQKLKEKMLNSELTPAGFENAMRNIQTEAEIFREANVPLFTRNRNWTSNITRLWAHRR
ncbi:MAG: hypothetical protein H0X30_11485 [Anaerolineae bacterium]|nr:hypothetical protein [Anaerolineae bacterium]